MNKTDWSEGDVLELTEFNFKDNFLVNLEECVESRYWNIAKKMNDKMEFLYRNIFNGVVGRNVLDKEDFANYVRIESFAKKFICKTLISGKKDKNSDKIFAAFLTKFEFFKLDMINSYAVLDMEFMDVSR